MQWFFRPTAILIANRKDRHNASPELSVIATHKAASKIIIVLSWSSSNEYNRKVESSIRSKLRRVGAPENFIVSFHGEEREKIVDSALEMFGWSSYTTSLIEFQNGGKMQIPKEITLEDTREDKEL